MQFTMMMTEEEHLSIKTTGMKVNLLDTIELMILGLQFLVEE